MKESPLVTNGARCVDAQKERLSCVRTVQQALGFVKHKGAKRETRHVDTKIDFMQVWAMEPGQRILKVHGGSKQWRSKLLIVRHWDDESFQDSTGVRRKEVQNISTHQMLYNVSITMHPVSVTSGYLERAKKLS